MARYEDVHTCILQNTFDEGLTFHTPERKKWGDSAVKYRVPETPGLCVLLNGPVRTDWKHEVPRLNSGHRLSISWRFYQLDDGDASPPRPAKRPRTDPPATTKLVIFSL